MTTNFAASLPSVRRARGYRLYLENGRRMVDLWQLGGRAALGHSPSGFLLALKNTAARGLTGPFQGRESRALMGALNRLVSTFHRGVSCVRWYADEGRAESVLLQCGYADAPPFFAEARRYPDPGADREEGSLRTWRPWSETDDLVWNCANRASSGLPPAVIPILPCPLVSAPTVLVFLGTEPLGLPPSDIHSPMELSALACVCDELRSSLIVHSTLDFAFLDGALPRGWTRRGRYLFANPPLGEAAYGALRSHFFAAGFLVPPSPADPFILPLELSTGERTSLLTAFHGIPQIAGGVGLAESGEA